MFIWFGNDKNISLPSLCNQFKEQGHKITHAKSVIKILSHLLSSCVSNASPALMDVDNSPLRFTLEENTYDC